VILFQKLYTTKSGMKDAYPKYESIISGLEVIGKKKSLRFLCVVRSGQTYITR